jgi:hypothetical protein
MQTRFKRRKGWREWGTHKVFFAVFFALVRDFLAETHYPESKVP